MSQAPDLRGPLFAAQDWYADLLAGVRDDQLTDPTPCPDFDVRTLAAHVATVQEKVTQFAVVHRDPFDRTRAPQDVLAEWAARELGGLSPAQRADHARRRTAQARGTWTDDVLDTPITLGWGPVLPGRVVTAIYLMEVLSHAWDLATATGQDAEAPAGLGNAGLQAARTGLPESPRGVDHGVPFGPVVPSAADAGPTEQMANWTGRVSRPSS